MYLILKFSLIHQEKKPIPRIDNCEEYDFKVTHNNAHKDNYQDVDLLRGVIFCPIALFRGNKQFLRCGKYLERSYSNENFEC